MKNLILSLMLLTCIVNVTANGAHNDPVGSVGLLDSEAEELNTTVGYSYLSYTVKAAVSRYVEDIRRLRECVEYGPRPMFHGHLNEVGCPQTCGINFRMVQRSFASVSRLLYDTQYDYPEVYAIFIQNQRALESIQLIGGPIGPGGGGPYIPPAQGLWQCNAVDNGWEEHLGGHVAYGNGIGQAQSQALYECQRSHGRCRIQRCQLVR